MLATVLAILAILLLIGLLLLVSVASVYSHASGLLGRCDNAYRQLASHLCHQSELLTQLARQEELADDQAQQASDAGEQVAALATADAGPSDAAHMQQLIAADSELQSATQRLLSAARGPGSLAVDQRDVPADELTLASSRVDFARQTYNDLATRYNQTLLQPPLRLVAPMLGFQPASCIPAPQMIVPSTENSDSR